MHFLYFLLNNIDNNIYTLNRSIFFEKIKDKNSKSNVSRAQLSEFNSCDNNHDFIDTIYKKFHSKSLLNKASFKNIPMQDEDLFIRNEYIRNCSSFNSKMKVINNLNSNQIRALKIYLKEKPF